MKYIIATIEWCLSKGIIVPEHARKSLDGNKVIFHYDFIAPTLSDSEEVECYEYDNPKLAELLSSPEWSSQEEMV